MIQMALNLDKVVAPQAGPKRGSVRILRDDAGQEAPLLEWIEALAAKLDVKPTTVRSNLHRAMLADGKVYGLTLTLASGRPFVKGKPRGPRKAKFEVVQSQATA